MSTKTEGTFTQAQLDAAEKAAFENGHAEGKALGHADGLKAGANAERVRISAILNSDAGKARPKAAMSTCLNTDMSADAAEKFLADLPEESARKDGGDTQSNPDFMNAMNNGQHPEVGSGDPSQADDANDSHSAVTSLAANFGLPGFKKK